MQIHPISTRDSSLYITKKIVTKKKKTNRRSLPLVGGGEKNGARTRYNQTYIKNKNQSSRCALPADDGERGGDHARGLDRYFTCWK